MNNCYICGVKFIVKSIRHLVVSEQDTHEFVCVNCYKPIVKSRHRGWQPPKGGPKLFLLRERG